MTSPAAARASGEAFLQRATSTSPDEYERNLMIEARRVVTALLEALRSDDTARANGQLWNRVQELEREARPALTVEPAAARPELPSTAAINAAVEAKYAALGRDDVQGDHDVMRVVLSAAYAIDAARPLASSLTVERLYAALGQIKGINSDCELHRSYPWQLQCEMCHKFVATELAYLLPRLAGPAQEGS